MPHFSRKFVHRFATLVEKKKPRYRLIYDYRSSDSTNPEDPDACIKSGLIAVEVMFECLLWCTRDVGRSGEWQPFGMCRMADLSLSCHSLELSFRLGMESE